MSKCSWLRAAAVGWKSRPLSKLKNDTRYLPADGNSGILRVSTNIYLECAVK